MEPGSEVVLAEVGPTADAEAALAAGEAGATGDQRSHLQFDVVGAVDDVAAELMAEHDRTRMTAAEMRLAADVDQMRPAPVLGEIAAADAGDRDREENLAGSRLGHRPRFDPDVALPVVDRRAHRLRHSHPTTPSS